MDIPVTSQPSATPAPGGPIPPAAAQDPGATTTQPPAASSAAPAAAASDFDPTKLTTDQLNKVLENPELWNLPRIKELREAKAALTASETAASKAADDKLAADKKFEELAQKRADENKTLNEKLQTMAINQALTNQLVKDNVVDLDGALKLIDRANLSVDDNGNVVGADDALASLKKDRSYLFTEAGSPAPAKPTVGSPSNPAAPAAGSGNFKFKESQLTPEFYKEHKTEIDEAGRLGLIEPDGPPR